MPKFTVEICYRTVETQWATVEVEAEDEYAAEKLARDMCDEDDVDWGKEEIVDGDYLFRAVPIDREE